MTAVAKPDWLPQELYQQWLDSYIEAGGTGVAGAGTYATEQVRQSPQYEQFFPGIKREDGSIRYPNFPEATYLNNMESYKQAVSEAGLNPDVFGDDYISLIEGDTSPQEFTARVENITQRVNLAGENIRNFYADSFGLEMTPEGIIGSLLSENVNNAILNRQITMAEIGGEAANRNYDLSQEFVGMLAEQGMDRGAAARTFGSANALLPVLSALAARHGDPDDDFDIEEFVAGAGLGDVGQGARMNRLQAQERAGFTGGAQVELVRNQRLGMTGLAQS